MRRRSTSSCRGCSGAGKPRSTRQKRAVAALLAESPGFRSAQDIFAELRSRGENVGLTTVYNQLGALADGGEKLDKTFDDSLKTFRFEKK